jgi:hypothetical protein
MHRVDVAIYDAIGVLPLEPVIEPTGDKTYPLLRDEHCAHAEWRDQLRAPNGTIWHCLDLCIELRDIGLTLCVYIAHRLLGGP